MAGILSILVILVALAVVGVGYFGYGGNVIVGRQSYDEADTSSRQVENITLSGKNIDKEEAFVDKCKGVVCDNSTIVCPDTFKSSCSNSCKDGICGNCTPDCKEHDFVTPKPNTSVASSPLKQPVSSPFSKSVQDTPSSLPVSGTQQQETQQPPSTPEPTQTSQTQIKQPKIVNIKFDADGDDRKKENWNTEWAEIDGQGIDMSGWTLLDNSTHKFTFPESFTISGLIKVRSGYGNNTQTDLYFGDGPIWNNNGDVAYLKDKDGNLVDTYSYGG